MLNFSSIFFYLILSQVKASEVLSPTPHDSNTVPNKLEQNQLDKFRAKVATDVVDLANYIDSFFSNERGVDQSNKSSLRYTHTQEFERGGPASPDFALRLNLKIPTLERWEDEMQEKWDEAIKKKRLQNQSAKENSNTTFPKEIDENPWRFSFDNKLSVKWPLRYSSFIRIRKDHNYGLVLQKFHQEIGYTSEDYWVYNLSLSHNIPLADDVLFFIANNINWKLSRGDFGTSHGPSISQVINNRNSITYNYRVNATVEDSHWFVSEYRVDFNHRLDVYKKWIFFNTTPYLSWPKDASFRRAPGLILSLEILFAEI